MKGIEKRAMSEGKWAGGQFNNFISYSNTCEDEARTAP
jgi:hypothetical protein